MKISKRGIGAAVGAVLALGTAASADWPQFRGPNHDSVSTGTIAKAWPAGGPKVLWKAPIGAGFGTFAVSRGKAFLLAEGEGQTEVCHAFDAATGKKAWATPLGATIHDGRGATARVRRRP